MTKNAVTYPLVLGTLMNLFLTAKMGEMKMCVRAVAALSDQTIAICKWIIFLVEHQPETY